MCSCEVFQTARLLKMFNRCSRWLTSTERLRQIIRYMAVMVSHTSIVTWVDDITCRPWKVSSWIEIIDTMDEYLIVLMNSFASGGSMIRRAWGRIINLSCWKYPNPRSISIYCYNRRVYRLGTDDHIQCNLNFSINTITDANIGYSKCGLTPEYDDITTK